MENTRKGTLCDAISEVSTIDIIEHFDVPNVTRRGRTYILCPGHDDTHFGSCYVDKNDNGYYCYVCAEHVTKWRMVLQLNGNKKAEACEWFFQKAGITPTSEKHNDPYKNALHLIRDLEKYIDNSVIYNDICVCEKIDSSYGRNLNGEYLYSELSITNPLMTIYKKDKDVFKKIVLNLLNAESQKVDSKIQFYKASPDKCIFIEGVGLVSHQELADACDLVAADIALLISTVNNF